jgi:hypothetical protein
MDGLRKQISLAREMYELAATPALNKVYTAKNPGAMYQSRAYQLNAGIDLKTIINQFLDELVAHHGDKRARRLKNWMEDGQINAYSVAIRQEIRADRNRLRRRIRQYKYI